jgi:hypothetical protein
VTKSTKLVTKAVKVGQVGRVYAQVTKLVIKAVKLVRFIELITKSVKLVTFHGAQAQRCPSRSGGHRGGQIDQVDRVGHHGGQVGQVDHQVDQVHHFVTKLIELVIVAVKSVRLVELTLKSVKCISL